MLTITRSQPPSTRRRSRRRRRVEQVAAPAPAWDTPHASLQDRALGLELELIELVRRRDEAAAHGTDEPWLTDDIRRVLDELADVAEQIEGPVAA